MFSTQPSFAIFFLTSCIVFLRNKDNVRKTSEGSFKLTVIPKTFCRRYYIHSKTSVELSASFNSYYAALMINQLSFKR